MACQGVLLPLVNLSKQRYTELARHTKSEVVRSVFRKQLLLQYKTCCLEALYSNTYDKTGEMYIDFLTQFLDTTLSRLAFKDT